MKTYPGKALRNRNSVAYGRCHAAKSHCQISLGNEAMNRSFTKDAKVRETNARISRKEELKVKKCKEGGKDELERAKVRKQTQVSGERKRGRKASKILYTQKSTESRGRIGHRLLLLVSSCCVTNNFLFLQFPVRFVFVTRFA